MNAIFVFDNKIFNIKERIIIFLYQLEQMDTSKAFVNRSRDTDGTRK